MKIETVYLTIAGLLSLSFLIKVVPVIQILAGTLAAIVAYRQILKGIKEEGGLKNYIKSLTKIRK